MMEWRSHNRNWGVVFKVAEKMRDAGVRPPPLLFLPPSAPSSSTSPPALSNLGWGCVFTRHQGFRGWFELLKGKKGRDGELRGVGGHKQRQLT